jgi:hypothetical protein
MVMQVMGKKLGLLSDVKIGVLVEMNREKFRIEQYL